MVKKKIISGVSIIICTMNRKDELRRLIDNIDNLDFIPKEIIIVNGGEDLDFFETKNIIVKTYKTSPGLTVQRSYGLTKISEDCDYILFLDDDTQLLNSDFILKSYSFMERVNTCVASSCTIVISDLKNIIPYFLSKTIGIRGSLLRNGINIPNSMMTSIEYKFFSKFTLRETYVTEWIPGCAMFIRMESMKKVEFDKKRVGYAEGEDVDISIKLREYGQLYIIRNNFIFHELSKKNRHTSSIKYKNRYLSRIKLGEDYKETISIKLIYFEIKLKILLFTIALFILPTIEKLMEHKIILQELINDDCRK